MLTTDQLYYCEFVCESRRAENPRFGALVLSGSSYMALSEVFSFSEP